MLRYKTELAWFSRLVRHSAGKRSGSILTNPEPTRGFQYYDYAFVILHCYH